MIIKKKDHISTKPNLIRPNEYIVFNDNMYSVLRIHIR